MSLTHISGMPGEVLKEVFRRAELRLRLEVELGRALSAEEFLRIADQTGLKI